MLELVHHKFILTLIVVLNLVLATWNYIDNTGTAHFLTPSTVVLYDVRPVDRMHVAFATATDGKDAKARFEPWSATVAETGLTELQLAKFHLGCYAAKGSAMAMPWESPESLDAWKLAGDNAKSSALTAMQSVAGGMKSRSVCNCIDQMLYSKLKKTEMTDKVQTALGDNVNAWQTLDPNVAAIEEFVFLNLASAVERKTAADRVYNLFAPLEDEAAESAFPIVKASFNAYRDAQGFTATGKSKYVFDTVIATADGDGTKRMTAAQFQAFRDSLAGGDLDGDLLISKAEFEKWTQTYWKPAGYSQTYIPYTFEDELAAKTDGDATHLGPNTWAAYVAKPHALDALNFIYKRETTTTFSGSALTFDYAGVGAANFHVEDDADMVLPAWAAKHKAGEYTKYNTETQAYKRDIVNFCTRHAVPQLQTTYEGTAEVNVMTVVGLFFILAAVMRDFHRHVWIVDEPVAGKGTGSYSMLRYLWNLVTVTLIVTGCILFFVQSTRATLENDTKTVAYRGDGKSNTSIMTPFNLTLYFFVALTLLVEFVYTVAGLKFVRDSDVGRFFLYDEAHTFLVFTLGWLLLGASLLLQTDVKHINSVYVFVLLITGACLVQYMSNYFSKIYNLLFKFLDSTQGVAMHTEQDLSQRKQGPSLSKFRVFMQFIGWGRLLISLTVIFHALLLVTIAKESTSVNPTKSLAEGRLLYYALAFLLANCGFDLIYEVLPFMFSNRQARMVRVYFILLYVFYINIMQRLYLQVNINAKWHKQYVTA